mgnify:CR=1 FL=1
MRMPEKSTAVTPHLTVKDVGAAMSFYEQAFGFQRKFMLPRPDGKVMHGEVVHDGCTIMIGPESLERGIRAPVSFGFTPVSLFVYVDDVDAAGAKVVLAPNDQFFGSRTCLLLDPDGHQWMFATHKKDVTVDEMMTASRDPHV